MRNYHWNLTVDFIGISDCDFCGVHSVVNRQLAALFTASELSRSLGIDYHHFPRGVRASSPQFEQFRMIKARTNNGMGIHSLKALKRQIRDRDAKRKIIRYIYYHETFIIGI